MRGRGREKRELTLTIYPLNAAEEDDHDNDNTLDTDSGVYIISIISLFSVKQFSFLIGNTSNDALWC